MYLGEFTACVSKHVNLNTATTNTLATTCIVINRDYKLMLTLKFYHLTSNKPDDQDLSCTIHLPSLVTIHPAVFVLQC